MAKNILIIGAAGLIGSALQKIFLTQGYKVRGADCELIAEGLVFTDITDYLSLAGLVKDFQPEVVILTAALSHVDYCETHPDESRKVNIGGLQNVIRCLNNTSAKLVFFSSDYIFDGAAGPYSEEDTPNPLSVYGKHKLEGEGIIRQAMHNYLILRTTWVYGTEIKGKNFVCSVLRRVKQGESVKIAVDQVSTPTYVFNLAQAVEELVHKDKTGTYNIVGIERIDRFNFASLVCEEFGLSKNTLVPVMTKTLGPAVSRPLSAGLTVDKLKKNISVRMLGVKEGLAAFRQEAAGP